MSQRQRPGMERGTRYKRPLYNPASGEPWRPGSNFEPANAVKLMEICEVLDMSVSGFLNQLVERLEVDPETGLPVGWPARAPRLKEAG